jgi:hypothetical protein
LRDSTETGFQPVTQEDFLSVFSTIGEIGEESTASALHKQHLNFGKVARMTVAIFKN